MKNLIVILLVLIGFTSQAQYTIESKEGYTPQIGVLVMMLEDLRSRVTYNVEKLTQEETDFLIDEDANRMGAIIFHLAATEKYYQVYTFENREFTEEEKKEWWTALELGKPARKEFKGKPIDYYLKVWEDVRKETLELLKTKDDEWLNAMTKNDSEMNNHWAWYHVMEHQANHMGQIALIKKRLPKRKN